MKLQLINKGRMVLSTIIATTLFFFSFHSIEAKSVTKTKEEIKLLAPLEEVQIPAEFDGQGILEIISFVQQPPGDVGNLNKNDVYQDLVINGKQLQLAKEAKYYHYLSQKITFDDLKQEDNVGYLLDPTDRIFELWVLAPVVKETVVPVGQKTIKNEIKPYLKAVLKNEGGVWSN